MENSQSYEKLKCPFCGNEVHIKNGGAICSAHGSTTNTCNLEIPNFFMGHYISDEEMETLIKENHIGPFADFYSLEKNKNYSAYIVLDSVSKCVGIQYKITKEEIKSGKLNSMIPLHWHPYRLTGICPSIEFMRFMEYQYFCLLLQTINDIQSRTETNYWAYISFLYVIKGILYNRDKLEVLDHYLLGIKGEFSEEDILKASKYLKGEFSLCYMVYEFARVYKMPIKERNES